MSAQTLQPWNQVKWERTVLQVCPWGVCKRIAELSYSKKSSLPDRFFCLRWNHISQHMFWIWALDFQGTEIILCFGQTLSQGVQLPENLSKPSVAREWEPSIKTEGRLPHFKDCPALSSRCLYISPSTPQPSGTSPVVISGCTSQSHNDKMPFCASGEVPGFSPSALCGKYQLLINFFHTDWWECLAKASKRDSTTHSHSSVVMTE